MNSGRLDNPVRLPARFFRGDPSCWNRLYRQDRNGGFTDATTRAGLSAAGDGNYGMGVATGDYDNDVNAMLLNVICFWFFTFDKKQRICRTDSRLTAFLLDVTC